MASSEAHPTLYMPIIPPPTPAPSPPPGQASFANAGLTALAHISAFAALPPSIRCQHLLALVQECTPSELLYLSTTIAPLLKRDFLRALPPEVSLHILRFIDEPRTLARASRVSRYWNKLLKDDCLWRRMCMRHGFSCDTDAVESYCREHVPEWRNDTVSPAPVGRGSSDVDSSSQLSRGELGPATFPYRKFFMYEYIRTSNWLTRGRVLRIHHAPLHPSVSSDFNAPLQNQVHNPAIPTSIAIDSSWVVVGLANSRIRVFSARTGVLSRTLVGHDSGVWVVSLISEGGRPECDLPLSDNVGDPRVASPPQDATVPPVLRHVLGLDQHAKKGSPSGYYADDPFAEFRNVQSHISGKPSYPGGSSDGWGQPNALVVSGGCDKELRVWDVKSGYCIYTLRGHTSTIRCLKVLHGRPIAVSGSRDRTLRVWDVQRGRLLRVLEGHTQSVRCLDVCGNRVVSGSYDCTCRVWDVDTGACLHVLRGHFHQIYTVAFDGVRVASGGLDTTVRVWDAATGACLALLQGHTALVCQLQLTPTMLATGGSDGRVIVFSLTDKTFSVVQRLAAHDSSVSGLQLDERILVTSGNDGRVRLYEFEQSALPFEPQCRYVRDMCEPSETVWKIAYARETCVVLCKKSGKLVVEIWTFKPEESE